MQSLIQPMPPRDPQEHGRSATPLELFFDLITVVAIASAAAGLHHSISEAHALQGVVTFLMAFFAIWWAWMNYTWFASAFDNNGPAFRLLTMVIMGGSLVMASGIGTLFGAFDLRMTVFGYVIMRIAMVILWLLAARGSPKHRSAAITYAVGVSLAQIFWILVLLSQPLDPTISYGLFALGMLIELSVPAIAERKIQTPWHRHHIIERYGLLTIIVLGETFIAAVASLEKVASGAPEVAFIHIALSALVVGFSMWWLYFSNEDHLQSDSLGRALVWGYGHFIIFASIAAVGAGFSVLVDVIAGEAKASLLVGDYAVGIPVAIFMTGLWFVRDRFHLSGIR